MNHIRLSDHFTIRRLLRFVLPSAGMMIFLSIYSVVDGFFVSNYAGKEAFAALNLIFPFPNMLMAFGFMLGTGGSALVAERLGQKRERQAMKIFTMLVKVIVILAICFTIIAEAFMPQAAIFLGADSAMLEDCVIYGRIIAAGIMPFAIQYYFQSLFVTAGKPNLGFLSTVLAGCTNILGDWILVAGLDLGLAGAAWATVASSVVGALIPLLYFSHPNRSNLHFVNCHLDGKALKKAMSNGASELLSNISANIINMLYNAELMKYAGADGVAAFGVISYANFIFISLYFGFSMGSAPIVSYHYGAGNQKELHSLFEKSLLIIAVCAGVLTFSSYLLSPLIARIFVGYDTVLCEMTTHGFRIYAYSFLIIGFNIYASSFFTALGNGRLSALISILRTLVFEVFSILILPQLFGLEGIWWAVTAAEALSLTVSVTCLVRSRDEYGY